MAKKRLIDRRLIGYWQSDRKRTFRDYVPRPGHKPAALKKFKSMFGGLILHYSPRKITSVSSDPESKDYEVVAADADSVVIRTSRFVFDGNGLHLKQVLVQIHFEGPNHYWVWESLISDFREFFRRIPAPKNHRKRKTTSSAPR